MIAHEPAPPESEPVQLWVPSETVTVPVGVAPGEATANEMSTASPAVEGEGVCAVIVVVEDARITVWGTLADVLSKNELLPA